MHINPLKIEKRQIHINPLNSGSNFFLYDTVLVPYTVQQRKVHCWSTVDYYEISEGADIRTLSTDAIVQQTGKMATPLDQFQLQQQLRQQQQQQQQRNSMMNGNAGQNNAFMQSAASAAYLQQQAAFAHMQSQQQDFQLNDIDHPGVNDVMCGRGGGTNNHIGNVRFRQLVNGHKLRYLAASKVEKPMVAREVVQIWRNLNPPGRFLAQDKSQGENALWNDIGDKKAREKASQCLRERTADVVPFVKQLELHQKLLEEEKKNADDGKKEDSTANSSDNEDGNKQTAAELGQRLLQQQQAAAVAAHVNLQANIPPSLLNSVHTQGDQFYNVRHSYLPDPPILRSMPQQQIDAQKMTMMLLQANIEAMNRAQNQRSAAEPVPDAIQSGGGKDKNSKKFTRDDFANAVPPAADLLNEIDDGQGLTLEEYQKDIEEFLGRPKGAPSNYNSEVFNNNSSKLVLDQDMIENLSKWDRSNSSIGSISMSSSMLMDVDCAFLRSQTNMVEADVVQSDNINSTNTLGQSAGKKNESASIMNFDASDRTSLTLDSTTLKMFMPGPDSNTAASESNNGDEHRKMPPPTRVTQVPLKSDSRPSLASGSSKTKLSSKGTSSYSMMSDMSEMSSKKGSSRGAKMRAIRGQRSDLSLASELTDLSENMNSMDLKH